MSTFLSPGVYVTEKDLSAIAPNIANNVAFFAGTFNSGPVGLPYVITNKVELERVFGTPDDQNYNEFFQAWKYLDYADQLIITRAYDENPFNLDPSYDATISDDPEFVGTYEDFVFDANSSTATFELSLGVASNISLPKFGVQDFITIGTDGIGSSANASLWEVKSFTPHSNSGINAEKINYITVNVVPKTGGAAGVPANLEEGTLYLHTKGYVNGETQAFQRQKDVNGNIPTNAIDEGNIDYLGSSNTFSETRLNKTYSLIKNDDEWDFLYTKDANPLRIDWINGKTNPAKGKLKFFNRTPTSDPVEVRIANHEDFFFETSPDGSTPVNGAIAFSSGVEDRIQVTPLTELFQYYPNEDQIALIFKQGNEIETYVVGFDPKGVDGNNRSNYIETVINETSNLLYVLENTNVNDLPATYLECDRFGRSWNETTKSWDIPPEGTETTGLTVQGGKTPRVSIGGLREAYFTVEDKERYEIDVVIGNELENAIAVDLAEKRKDCIAYIGANYQDVVGRKALEATNRIIGYITENNDNKRALSKWGRKLTRSMFAAFFGNYFRIYDNYNKKYRWINVAGDMAGIRCEITTTNASWWVSAGLKRGIIRGIDRMGFTPSLPMRDNLYKNSVNPLVTFPGTGHLVWGNKTLQSYASAFDRINVRSMFNTIERSMSKSAKSQVFEFNDPFTRNAMLSMFNPYLAAVKAGRGITDFLVICDETNNNPEVLKTPHELRVDIFIKPNYAAEFIQLNFVNVGTRSFVEVIGA